MHKKEREEVFDKGYEEKSVYLAAINEEHNMNIEERLAYDRVVSFEISEDNTRLLICEECDIHFCYQMTKAEILELIEVLHSYHNKLKG